MPTIKIEVTYDPSCEKLDDILRTLMTPEARPAAPIIEFAAPAVPETPETPELVETKPTEDEHLAEVRAMVTKSDIRALAVSLSKTDKAKLISILNEFGASKLSEVPESAYADLKEKLVSANA